MIKKLLCIIPILLLLGLSPSGGGGGDQPDFPLVYIDEGCAGTKVGSLANPYDDLADINWDGGGDNDISVAVAANEDVVISLMEDDEWRETLTVGTSGSAAHPITITSYGSGADPIINGADVVEAWTQYGTWQTAVDIALDSDFSNALQTSNLRQVCDANASSYSGTKIRITAEAHSTEDTPIGGASIGASASNDDFDTTPTRITWVDAGGGDGRTIPAGTKEVSDEIEFTFTKTNRHLIHFYLTAVQQRYKSTGTYGSYYSSDAQGDQTLTQAVTYGSQGPDVVLDKIEVYSPVANVWQAALATEPNQIFLNGTRGNKQVNLGAVDSANDWYWASNVLYVYYTEDPDGAVVIEASQRDDVILATGYAYITIDGLDVKYSNTNGVRGGAGNDNNIIQNCTLQYNYQNGIYYTGDSYDDCLVDSNTVSYNQSHGITMVNLHDSLTISNNSVHHNCSVGGADPYDYSAGIKIWAVGCTNTIVEDNTVYSNNWGYVGGEVIGVGIWIDTVGAGCIVRRNEVYDNYYFGIFIEDTDGVQVYQNLVYDHTDNISAGIRIGRSSENNVVYNNVSYANAIGIQMRGTSTSVVDDFVGNLVKNNICFDNTTREFTATYGAENDGTYGNSNVYTHNCFGVEAANFIEWGITNYDSTYDDWETSYGGTTYSAEKDPLMTDPANDDFHLNPHSPCINAGTDVGLTEDYEGLKIRHAPDIGAYENQANAIFSAMLRFMTGGKIQ